MSYISQKIMLLGSGELGREFVIAAKRMGLSVVAVDSYVQAPAMQLADEFEVINMLDGQALERIVLKHKPDIIVPEIEAIRTEKLQEFEDRGIRVVPTAKATHLTMNRDEIRDLAKKKLKLKTADYMYAESFEELSQACLQIGFPCVVKPVMSSSGKGQSVVKKSSQIGEAWDVAVSGMRGNTNKVIVEEFIPFDHEITLLTIKQRKGKTLFVSPIGHRQERGDYQESWIPARLSKRQLQSAQRMAKRITDQLGGAGLFGVEFFVTKKEVYFSELSPRPHDTGMVTIISQDLNEFELHLRAVMGWPIPEIKYWGPSASAVILGKSNLSPFVFQGIEKALKISQTDIRIFGKPKVYKHRRMGVALARAKTVDLARKKAKRAADAIKIMKQQEG